MVERNCYEKAFAFMVIAGEDAEHYTLVHGYPKLSAADGDVPEGTRYGHAWVEFKLHGLWMAYDVMSTNMVPRTLYYTAGRIDPSHSHRYTYAEALAMVRKTGHLGDWEEGPVGTAYHNDEEDDS